MKAIIITVDPAGNTKIETAGFKGKACKDVTAVFEKGMGTVTKTTNKPEMYQVDSNQQKVSSK